MAVLTLAAGCGGSETCTSDKTAAQIAEEIMGSGEFAMGGEELSECFGVTKDSYTDIYACNGMMTSADTLYVAKVAEGRAGALKAEFEARLETVRQNFEQYLPDAYNIAKGGQAVARGNYVMLVISADNEKARDIQSSIVKK